MVWIVWRVVDVLLCYGMVVEGVYGVVVCNLILYHCVYLLHPYCRMRALGVYRVVVVCIFG